MPLLSAQDPHHKITDPQTIQVFILSLMNHVGYPLSYANVADIVMQDSVVSFMDFGEYFKRLLDNGHIVEHGGEQPKNELNPHGHPTYTLSDTGRRIVEGLESTIPPYTREMSYRSAIRYLDFARKGATVEQNLASDGNGTVFHCLIRDRDGTQLDLTLRPANEYQLRLMQTNFGDHPEKIYKSILAILTGETDYLNADR